MKANKEILKMANYILEILRSNVVYMMSWGFNSPKAIFIKDCGYGLRFKVNGFIHKGIVDVIYDEGTDSFDVILRSNNGKEIKKIEKIYLDQLCDIIDENVEKVKNYNERVKNEYL